MGLTESRAEETIIYVAEPAIVAEACQAVIQQRLGSGKVTEVSRETGTIAGKFKMGFWTNYVFINLRISRTSEGTELHIQTQRNEGIGHHQGGAQKGLATFLTTLGSDPRLAQGTTGAW